MSKQIQTASIEIKEKLIKSLRELEHTVIGSVVPHEHVDSIPGLNMEIWQLYKWPWAIESQMVIPCSFTEDFIRGPNQ